MKAKPILLSVVLLGIAACSFMNAGRNKKIEKKAGCILPAAKNDSRAFALKVPDPNKLSAAAKEPAVDADWYAKTVEELRKKEYNITFDQERKTYQSPNRNNNLRFSYSEKGFTAEPREIKIPLFDVSAEIAPEEKTYQYVDDWHLSLTVDSYGRKTKLEPFTGSSMIVHDNLAVSENEKLAVHYTNLESGMRQDFIVKEKPGGAGFLTVSLKPETDLHMRVGADQAVFINEETSEQVMRYASLSVWDANGKSLRGWMEESPEGNLLLVVNDESAAYPVTIDPLSSSPVWTNESNFANANMGSSLAAGDFNGDGYSDAMIGLFGYQNSYPAEGGLFVFMGTATGYTTLNWTIFGCQAYAHLGLGITSISSGDFNDDGYSDIIAGMRDYDNGQSDEGMVCIWMSDPASSGHPWGWQACPSGASWKAESNLASARFGSSVAAGDFNGDGKSDLAVGSYQYSNGNSNEGAAFVWYSTGAAPIPGATVGTPSNCDWRAEGAQNNAYLGYSVCGAGDVNGDGYGDIIVGAQLYDNGQTDEGGAFVWAGSSTGLTGSNEYPASTNVLWRAESNVANSRFGETVFRAGDVDGNGCGDVIVGAPWYSNGQSTEGGAFVWLGSTATDLGADGTPANADWKVEGNVAATYLGDAVSLAGDVDGDGYSDVIVSSYHYNAYQGLVQLYNGSPTGLSASPTWTATSGISGCEYGATISSAGDINGDGFSDILVGARLYTNGQTNEGRAYAYYGSASGLSLTNAFGYRGSQNNQQFGYSIAFAGDVNGDGYSDFIVGAPTYDNGQTDEGGIWVFRGSASGPVATPYWTAESNQAGSMFGASVSSAGDVDYNGYSDVIVGAPFYSNGETNEGVAFVWLGSSTGFGATGTPANADWLAEPNQASARFGTSVACAGDVNRDGSSDIIIGSPLYDVLSLTDAGAAMMWYGSVSGLGANGTPANADWFATGNIYSQFGYAVSSAGDVNKDQYSDVIVGAPLYSNGQTNEGAVYEFNGGSTVSAAYTWLGEINVVGALLGEALSTAGDVNGDRYSDIIVGAYNYTNGQASEGGAFVWHGSATGFAASPDWSAQGEQIDGNFGESVSTAGDVNADGFSDIIVGAYHYDNGEANEGKVFAWYGSSSGLGASGTPSNADWGVEGNEVGAELGLSVAGGGDINGDGFGDALSGARFADNHSIVDAGTTAVYYGNEKKGVDIRPRQLQTNLTVPLVAPLYSGGSSGTANNVGTGINARSFYGRMDLKVHKEFYMMYNDYLTTDISATWLDASGSGYQYDDITSGVGGGGIRWRQRFQYRLSEGGYQPYGRWYYLPDNAVTEEDFFTCELCIPDDEGRWAPDEVSLPAKLEAKNYPNPFGDETIIAYVLPENSEVTVQVFSISGQLVSVLVNHQAQTAGRYSVVFDGRQVAPGTYFYTVSTDKEVVTHKMVLVK